jgi:hypothetical protein
MKLMGITLFFSLLCLSCTPPPFFEPFMRDAAAAAKMTKEATVKTAIEREENIDPNIVFLPVKTPSGVDCTRGFIQNLESSLFFTYAAAGGSATFRRDGNAFPHSNPYPNKATSLFVPIKTGDYVITFVILPGNDGESRIRFFYANTAASPPQFQLIGSDPTLMTYVGMLDGSTQSVMAVCVPPAQTPSLDTCYILYRKSANTYGEIEATLDNFGLQATPNYRRLLPTFPLPMLDGLPNCQYFSDPNSTELASYACIPAGRVWKTYRWSGDPVLAGPDEMTGITARIDAILSTGELFSTENGTGRVYSTVGSGSERLSFPLSNLKFAYETYVNGIPRMFFTQAFKVERRVWFNVYSIPTAELEKLAGN